MIRAGNVYMAITDFERKLPVYLNSVGRWKNQYQIDRTEGHSNYQWIQCIGGRGLLKANGKEYEVSEGQGMLLFPHEPHEYHAIVEPWEVCWISFSGMHVAEMMRSVEFDGSRVLSITNPDPLLKNHYELISKADSSDPINILKCSSILYTVILDLYLYGSHLDLRSKQQHFAQLSPALQFIENNCHLPITLQDLATSLSVSPQHTCQLFQLTLGMRPFEYITSVRLCKAKEILQREPSLGIAEVANRVGYEHPSYFIKMFKRNEGMTPRRFRNNF